MNAAQVRVRLVVDSGGACAVLVTRPRPLTQADREPAFAAEIPQLVRRIETAGLRFAGLSVASSDPEGSGASVSVEPGETLGAAVQRALERTAAVGSAR